MLDEKNRNFSSSKFLIIALIFQDQIVTLKWIGVDGATLIQPRITLTGRGRLQASPRLKDPAPITQLGKYESKYKYIQYKVIFLLVERFDEFTEFIQIYYSSAAGHYVMVATGPSSGIEAKAHLRSDVFTRSATSCSMSFYYNMNSRNNLVRRSYF